MDLELHPYVPESGPPEDLVIALIHFGNAWTGSLALAVDPATACKLAGRLLLMDAPSSVNADVRDVIGELANMIGGNLKSDFAPDSTMSLPEVICGTENPDQVRAIEKLGQCFLCEEGIVWVV
jgi:chemotaxis protein CheX